MGRGTVLQDENETGKRGRLVSVMSSENWALILGASSGFGAATARTLAKAGFGIFGVHLDRRATLELVEDLKKEIEASGQEALFFNVNASSDEKRAEVIGAIKEKLGSKGPRIRVLMHSLAFGTLKPFVGGKDEPINKAQMDMTLDVMAHSLVYWTQDLVREDLLGEGTRIVAMTSSGGERVFPYYGAVSAAKAALESHIRQLSMELISKGISANSIRAGVTDTPALRKIPGNERMLEAATRRNPGGRLTKPEDVAEAICALALSGCHWLTGNVIGVDGGENTVE